MSDEIDVICPVYWVNKYFYDNIYSWLKELPYNNIFFGINNPKIEELTFFADLCHKLLIRSGSLHSFNQHKLKTLGACLRDLMKKVETSWFAFIHADAQLTPYCYQIMKKFMRPRVGIIESERVHFDGKSYSMHDPPFSTYNRAFSGFQIFRKSAIESILDKIEDDYIYRNEDMIFQAECLKNGYRYEKTWAMHIHQTTNKEWTFDKQEATKMQVFGLIKYTEPTKITKKYLKGYLYNYLMGSKSYKIARDNLVIFIGAYPKWKFLLKDRIMRMM